jgi:hypothetical protein
VLLLCVLPAAASSDEATDLSASIEYLAAYEPNIEFPAAGAIFTSSNGTVHIKCSGTLIAPTLFLTSAHCFDGLSPRFDGSSPQDFKVFLQAEGIIDVSKVYFYCSVPGDDCDEHEYDEERTDEHDVALVMLKRPATVWPAIEVATEHVSDDPDSSYSATRWGYGATYCSGASGTGIKSDRAVDVKNCDDDATMLCQWGPGGPYIFDSGGPLVFEAGQDNWIDTAVTRSGGSNCPSYGGTYVSVWSYAEWIAEIKAKAKADQAAWTEHKALEIKWWGRLEQGVLINPELERQFRGSGLPKPVKVLAPPSNFEHPAWPAPEVPNADLPDGLEVPEGKGVTLLRVTMSYQPTNPVGPFDNRFKLTLRPPEGPTGTQSAQAITCDAPVFIECDAGNPAAGVWRIDVTGMGSDYYGPYQLLALLLGPAEPATSERDGLDRSDVISVGQTFSTGPFMFVNTTNDGSPSDDLKSLIDFGVEVEISRLKLRLGLEQATSGFPK